MDMNLSKLREIEKEAWLTAAHGATKSRMQLSNRTQQQLRFGGLGCEYKQVLQDGNSLGEGRDGDIIVLDWQAQWHAGLEVLLDEEGIILYK